jgi:TonB family protein
MLRVAVVLLGAALGCGGQTPSEAQLALQQAANTRIAEVRESLLDKAQLLGERALAANPRDVDALYSLGVVGWMRSFQPPARAGIEEALDRFRSVLEIDPHDNHAMTYLHLLYRARAKLAASPEERQSDLVEAGKWQQQAVEAAAANQAEGRIVRTPPVPPRPAEAFLRYPIVRNTQLRLVHRVKPVYPEAAKQARIEGTVRVNAMIAKDGSVADVGLVSGHPLLVQAAIDAVKQWLYRPPLRNGVPIEMRIMVDVGFSLSTE